jgi:hypothetical protein
MFTPGRTPGTLDRPGHGTTHPRHRGPGPRRARLVLGPRSSCPELGPRLGFKSGSPRYDWRKHGTENPGVGSSILPLSTISFARQSAESPC